MIRLFAFLCLSFPLVSLSQTKFHISTDVVYGHKAGMALTYDVYRPVDSANGAGIIHVVSGGWNSRYFRPDSIISKYIPFLEAGYTIFALRHGSNPQFTLPESVDDVMAGVWHINHHSARYGVDSSRIGIFGGSSGGQLALMAGLSGEKHPVNAVVAFFAPADLRNIPDFIKSMLPALDFDTALAASVSPVLLASPDDPPTLLIHGTSDFVVAPWQSENMYAALQEKQVVSRLVLMEGMMHGTSFGGKGKYYEEGNREMIGWFDRFLRGKPNTSLIDKEP